jgi:hypothetical protein
LHLLRPDLWPSEPPAAPADAARLGEDVVLRLARSLLALEPDCKSSDCNSRECARSQLCVKWEQNVLRYLSHEASDPNSRTVERMMLEMIRRYGAFQRTQIR